MGVRMIRTCDLCHKEEEEIPMGFAVPQGWWQSPQGGVYCPDCAKQIQQKEAYPLEEAIQHALDVVHGDYCEECQKDHLQLAVWLEELRQYRELINRRPQLSIAMNRVVGCPPNGWRDAEKEIREVCRDMLDFLSCLG